MNLEYLKSKFLEDSGFKLYKCPHCGEYYYGFDSNSCGEFPEIPYIFLEEDTKNPSFGLRDFINLFNQYFESQGHEVIKRYPVVCRWRDDLLLTIASISCFQPFVTEGLVKAPANPLVIHQPCFRFDDFREVGYTGRHSISFTMTAHHAFNLYWKEELLRYCFEFLTEYLNIPKERIRFKLGYWSGGGNAGECYEVMVDGLEVATLVLMHYKEDPNGSIEIKGDKYKEIDNRIIDTGYGAERFVWMVNKKENVFEANYPEITTVVKSDLKIDKEIEKIYLEGLKSGKIEKEKIEPLADAYRLIDFTRVILFLCADACVPSNKKEGYLLRLSIRNALSIVYKYRSEMDISKYIKLMYDWIRENLDPDMNEEHLNYTLDVIETEKEKFEKIVQRFESMDLSKITKEKAIKLYESEGFPIFLFKDKLNFNVYDVIDELTKKEIFTKKKKKEEKFDIPENLPATKKLYYKDPYKFEIEANILYEDDDYIILDKTIFYPEGGGQPSDTGQIGDKKIKSVKKYKDYILHFK